MQLVCPWVTKEPCLPCPKCSLYAGPSPAWLWNVCVHTHTHLTVSSTMLLWRHGLYLSFSVHPHQAPCLGHHGLSQWQVNRWRNGWVERECVQEVENSLGALVASEGAGVGGTCGMRYSACTTLVVSTVTRVLSWQFAMYLSQLFPALLQVYLHTYFLLTHGWCHTHHSRNYFQT